MASPQSFRDLDMRHFAALRAVAEEGTFGRAATRLGFTQSAVSQQIATLERLVGEPLFDRPGGPRPVTLTAAGHLLLPHAVAVLERVRAAEADLAGLQSAQTGTVRVGTFQSVSVRVLPDVLASLHKLRPNIRVLPFESDDQAELIALLRAGELDLSFLVGPARRRPARHPHVHRPVRGPRPARLARAARRRSGPHR